MRVILPPYYKRSSNLHNPFGEDYFLRREFANNLTHLFRGAEESMVLTLNAKWGEGKTTFIKQWEKSLKEEEQFIPIYYDAFQNDFTSDVFFSIAVSIQEALIAHFKSIGKDPHKSEKIDFLKQSTIELAKELFIIGAETASNFYGGSTFGLKDFVRKVFGQYQSYKEEKERKFLDEKFNSYLGLKNSIKKYQRKLDKILEHSNRSNNKIIFFVDELDRCRPNFAVEVIEKIKHLFEVPNVYFLLAINKEQLLKTIKNVYGVGEEEAFIYLQKFVHLETELPSMSELSGNNEHNIKLFITETVQYLEFPKEIIEIEKIYELVVFLMPSSRLDLNPRSIERILTLIAICINSCTKERAKELSRYFIFLSFYKVRDKDLYHQLKKGKINSAGLLDDKNNSKRVFEWLQKNFFDESQFSKSASNVIEVPGLFEAGGILDIYNIPSESSNKFKKKDNYQSQEK